MSTILGKIRDTCQTFDWMLKEVYPGLQHDALTVRTAFEQHLGSGYLEKALQPLLLQYSKGKGRKAVGDTEKPVRLQIEAAAEVRRKRPEPVTA